MLVVQFLHKARCIVHPLCDGGVACIRQPVAGLIADAPGVEAGAVPDESNAHAHTAGGKVSVLKLSAGKESAQCFTTTDVTHSPKKD